MAAGAPGRSGLHVHDPVMAEFKLEEEHVPNPLLSTEGSRVPAKQLRKETATYFGVVRILSFWHKSANLGCHLQ